MNELNAEKEIQISNEYDYSNVIPLINSISYLVQYCDSLFQYLLNLTQEDEIKNEKLKYEYKEYSYKKAFDTEFLIVIQEKGSSFSRLECTNYETFAAAVHDGHLNNVEKLTITLNLNYSSGKEGALKKHINKFLITFAPYNIIFARNSNFNDPNMNEIENNINEILRRFGVQDTIFCTK